MVVRIMLIYRQTTNSDKFKPNNELLIKIAVTFAWKSLKTENTGYVFSVKTNF